MTVWIDQQGGRKFVPLKFNGITGDTFNVRATREGDPEAHSSGPHPFLADENGDGSFVESFPTDFAGAVKIEITGSDGSRSEGTVSIL